MTERTYWLKAVGAADWPMKVNWVETEPTELEYVAFPDTGSPSVRPGDHFVYYAAGHQKLFGIVEVMLRPTKDNVEERWPWRCRVGPRLVIAELDRAPHLDAIAAEGERDFHKVVMQKSHVTLTEEEYQRAFDALAAAYDGSRGDIRDAWWFDHRALAGRQTE